MDIHFGDNDILHTHQQLIDVHIIKFFVINIGIIVSANLQSNVINTVTAFASFLAEQDVCANLHLCSQPLGVI